VQTSSALFSYVDATFAVVQRVALSDTMPPNLPVLYTVVIFSFSYLLFCCFLESCPLCKRHHCTFSQLNVALCTSYHFSLSSPCPPHRNPALPFFPALTLSNSFPTWLLMSSHLLVFSFLFSTPRLPAVLICPIQFTDWPSLSWVPSVWLPVCKSFGFFKPSIAWRRHAIAGLFYFAVAVVGLLFNLLSAISLWVLCDRVFF